MTRQTQNMVKVQEKALKGNAILKHIVLQSEERYKPWIFIQIWSKSVEN